MQNFLPLGFVVSVREGTGVLDNWLRSDDLVKFEVTTHILETDVLQSSEWCWDNCLVVVCYHSGFDDHFGICADARVLLH